MTSFFPPPDNLLVRKLARDRYRSQLERILGSDFKRADFTYDGSKVSVAVRVTPNMVLSRECYKKITDLFRTKEPMMWFGDGEPPCLMPDRYLVWVVGQD